MEKIQFERHRLIEMARTLFCAMLLLSWAAHFASPVESGGGSSDNCSSIHCVICRSIPSLNEIQVNICTNVPQSLTVLTNAQPIIAGECKWQFRKDQWDCAGITNPIIEEPSLKLNKETAFAYALTSAVTVHQITSACSNGDLGSECGCDTSRNGLVTVQGWKWGSCSDNVSYGITFAQNFLDSRELDRDSTDEEEVSKALVHLHNNAVGRRIVRDNMDLACRCHGFSGSCSLKTCWRELPTAYDISDALKNKYNEAVKVEVSIPRDGSPASLRYFDPVTNRYTYPPDSSLVYVEQSEDFCTMTGNFTRNRHCMPEENLPSGAAAAGSGSSGSAGSLATGASYGLMPDLREVAMAEHFPPCETFCCNGQYVEEVKTISQTCNCRFVWCCDVVCDTCTSNVTEYRCTG